MSSIIEKAAQKLKDNGSRQQSEAQPQVAGSEVEGTPSNRGTVPERAAAESASHSAAGYDSAPVHIDFEALYKAGMSSSTDSKTHIADQYRRIKRPLLANITGKGAATVADGRRVMVTSSIPGEGKTFTSFNLALSMALERDHSVLLIDGDVAKRDMTEILNFGDRPGLLDILGDRPLKLEQAIVRTDVPRLSILPAGQWNEFSTELLASRRMETFLDAVTYSMPDCIVVFDSPPLLATSEASVLAELMGQIVVVVAAASTAQSTVKEAIKGLNTDKSINMILNMVRGAVDSKRYGGYYYGGGYYNRSTSPHD